MFLEKKVKKWFGPDPQDTIYIQIDLEATQLFKFSMLPRFNQILANF